MTDHEYRIGDAFELVRELEAGSVDAVVTSPPYADQRGHGPKPDAFAAWITPLLVDLGRVVSPTGCFMLNLGRIFRRGVEHPYIEQTLEASRLAGWKRVDTIIWKKLNAIPFSSARQLHNTHEYVFWLARDVGCYRGYDAETRTPYAEETIGRYTRRYFSSAKGEQRGSQRRNANPDGALPKSVYECAVGRNRGIKHETPMALELAEHLVSLSCPRGGLILDPFAGSGTTAVAAMHRGRRSLSFEIDPEAAAEIPERLAQRPLEEAVA